MSDVYTVPADAVNAAVTWAKLDADRDAAIRAFCAAIGDAPTYDQFEAVRVAVCEAWKATNPKLSDDAVRQRFARLKAAAMEYATREGFDFAIGEKPRAETAEAARKRAERAAGGRAIAKDMLEKGSTPEQVKEAAKERATAGNPADLKIAADMMLEADKAAEKAANEATSGGLKALKERITAAMKAAKTEAALLDALRAIVEPAKPAAKGGKAAPKNPAMADALKAAGADALM